MALTKVGGSIIQNNINVVGVVTASAFVGSGVGLTGITGGASQVYDKTVFAYQNVVQSNISISAPYNTSIIYTSSDVTVDIENGVQLDVDNNCVLLITDV
jgi:hypothetical protein